MGHPTFSPLSTTPGQAPAIHIHSPVQQIKSRLIEVLDAEREWRRTARAHLRIYRFGEDQRYIPFTNIHRGHFTTNLTFAHIRTIVPVAAFRAPKINVSPLAPEDESKAPLLESVCNDALEGCAAELQFRKTLLDALIVGRGYTKIGYHTEFGYDPTVLDPRKYTGPKKRTEVEFDEYILEERAFLKRCSPFNIARDPMYDDIHEGRWIAERFVRPLDTLQADRRFTGADKITQNNQFMGTDDIYSEEKKDQEGFWIDSAIWNHRSRPDAIDRPIEYWVFYDKRTRKIYTVCEGLDDWLAPPRDWVLEMNGFSYEELKPYEIPEKSQGTSIVEQIAWHQFEINEVRRFQVDMIKRQNPKMGAKKNAISTEDRDRYERGVPGAIVEMTGRDDLWQIEQPTMTADNYRVIQDLMGDMSLISGISHPNLGGQRMGASRTTATENVREQSGFQTRVDDIVRHVELHGARCAEKLAAVITQMYTDEDFVRVAGPEGMKFQPYVGVELAGRYRFTSEVGSTMPQNEAVRRKQVLDAFALFSQFPNKVSIDELIRRTIRMFPEIGRDYDKLLISPKQRLAQMSQDMILQQLAQEFSTPSAPTSAQGAMGGNGAPPEGARQGGPALPPGTAQGVEEGGAGLGEMLSRANKVTA